MHNNIMAAGSKDRPPMLGPGRYSQWRSRFLWYIDTKPNGEGLRKSILSGPYVPSTGGPAIKEIDTISYHTHLTFLKQYQNEVNDIRAKRIAKSANPLALLAAAQPYSDNYYQAPKPQRTNTTSSSTRPSASTRHKGKEIAKPVTPQSESVSEEDSDLNKLRGIRTFKRIWTLLSSYFKKLYKPTTTTFELLQTPGTRLKIPHQGKTVIVQQMRIQCFNCKGFGHYAKECKKPKCVKDYSYHKEKMMMCKQAEQGVPLQADWLADTDEEIDEQELEAHYR
ncbi:retrovirus-related pol polyprotein from transposon TNT 1-94 [Tanacetum coccineum]